MEHVGGRLDVVPETMSISQLAKRSGVPQRRIRYYVSEGLLSPPNGRGRAANYSREHLDRLLQICALREGNLSLDEIRSRLGEPSNGHPVRPSPTVSAESWERWELVPGVEVHARDNLDPEMRETLTVLLDAVRHVLVNGERNGTEENGRAR